MKTLFGAEIWVHYGFLDLHGEGQPAAPGPDAVLRPTSDFAGQWHCSAQATPAPPAGRPPTARLRALDGGLIAELRARHLT